MLLAQFSGSGVGRSMPRGPWTHAWARPAQQPEGATAEPQGLKWSVCHRTGGLIVMEAEALARCTPGSPSVTQKRKDRFGAH